MMEDKEQVDTTHAFRAGDTFVFHPKRQRHIMWKIVDFVRIFHKDFKSPPVYTVTDIKNNLMTIERK
jgi:sulfur relay (sulfurtransferase) DsrC/TusE family protein